MAFDANYCANGLENVQRSGSDIFRRENVKTLKRYPKGVFVHKNGYFGQFFPSSTP